MTRKTEWPLVTAIAGLLAALLVCICLLALPTYNKNSGQLELEVAKQDYQRELSVIDRKYEAKINGLQEQVNSMQFVMSKRHDLLEDDVKRIERDIDDIAQRIKPRKQ